MYLQGVQSHDCDLLEDLIVSNFSDLILLAWASGSFSQLLGDKAVTR